MPKTKSKNYWEERNRRKFMAEMAEYQKKKKIK